YLDKFLLSCWQLETPCQPRGSRSLSQRLRLAAPAGSSCHALRSLRLLFLQQCCHYGCKLLRSAAKCASSGTE
ncbi:hypothetical protein T265_16357, partial [Opisthorchis viverrini]